MHQNLNNNYPNTLLFLVILFLLTACSSMIANPDREPSYALQDVDQTSLARHYQSQIQQHNGKSGFILLGSGIDAFAARTELFAKAEKSIDVQYYLVRDDLTGYLFYNSLKQAADRGVRVRILLDDYELARQTAKLAAFDQHPNIEIRVFNPFSRHAPRFLQYVFQLGKITRRMHNKSVIVDNNITIVGSRNIGNEYSEAQAKRVFSGMEALAVGPIVNEVSKSFDRYWNFQKTINVSALSAPSLRHKKRWFVEDPERVRFTRVLRTSPLVQQIKTGTLPFRWAWAKVIQDQPEKIIQKKPLDDAKYLNVKLFDEFVKKTKNEILIITPYFIPREQGMQYFKKLRDRGIKISILTNSYESTDMRIVNAHYNKYRKDLLRMGIKLYEFKSAEGSINLLQRAQRLVVSPAKAGLHAKIISFDQSNLYIGSMNMDPRSLYENTEIGIMIASKEIAGHIVTWFDKNLNELAYHVKLQNNDDIVWIDYANNQKRLLHVEPDTIISQRMWMKLMSLLPVESQL